MKDYKNILDFISEAGMLKQMPRSGWSVLGIKNPESVADHSFRCGVIGYLLARLEGADAYQVMFMCLFGDICEARITDLHKMAQKYIKSREIEDRTLRDQAKKMPVQELPGTKKEVEQINGHLKLKAWETHLLVGDDALEEEIKRINNPFLLHIATHGYFLADRRIGKGKVFGIEPEQAMENPLLRSGLLFTGADNTMQSIGSNH